MLMTMPMLGMPSETRGQVRKMLRILDSTPNFNNGPQITGPGSYASSLGNTYGTGAIVWEYKAGNTSKAWIDKNGRFFGDRFQSSNATSGPNRIDLGAGGGTVAIYCGNNSNTIIGTISNQSNAPTSYMTFSQVSSVGVLAPTSQALSQLGQAANAWKSLFIDQTNTAPGTTGNQTINKAQGRVNIAAAGTTVTVTSSVCTAASQVYAVCATNDSTAYVKNVVPAAGSFVITLGAAATAETAISWTIFPA